MVNSKTVFHSNQSIFFSSDGGKLHNNKGVDSTSSEEQPSLKRTRIFGVISGTTPTAPNTMNQTQQPLKGLLHFPEDLRMLEADLASMDRPAVGTLQAMSVPAKGSQASNIESGNSLNPTWTSS